MKFYVFLFALITSLLAFSSSALAQARDPDFKPKTLFSDIQHHGFYFSPVVHQAPVHKENGLWFTYRLAYQMNHKFAIGAAGGGLLSRHLVNLQNEPAKYKFNIGYGGLLLEYTVAPASLVHFSIPVVIGAGGVSYNIDKKNSPDSDNYNVASDGFFIVEPGLQIEVNLLRFLRLTAGGNYRYVSGINMPVSTNKDFSGFTGTVGFKVGIL